MKITMLTLFTLLSTSIFASTYPQTRDQAIEVYTSYFASTICAEYEHTGRWDYFCGDDRYVFDDLSQVNGQWQIEVRESPYMNTYFTIEADGSVSAQDHYLE